MICNWYTFRVRAGSRREGSGLRKAGSRGLRCSDPSCRRSGWTAAAAEGGSVGRAERAVVEMAADADHHGRGKFACPKPAGKMKNLTVDR